MQLKASEQNLRQHVYHLAQDIGERNIWHPAALHATEDYIKRTWRKQDYKIEKQVYMEQDVPCSNLEITNGGSSRAGQIILLGAHYDTVRGSPGANDNGSGIAVLLELSRLLHYLQTTMTIRFVAFVNEEAPFFNVGHQGSLVYAKAARQHGDDIRLMIALETMGYYCNAPHSQSYPPLFRFFYPDRANFISLVSNFRSRSVMRKFAHAFHNSTDFPLQHVATFGFIPGVSWSDHLSFWRQGYKALMVTDTAFYRYPYYHSAKDTAEKLDYVRLAQVCDGLFKAVKILANGHF